MLKLIDMTTEYFSTVKSFFIFAFELSCARISLQNLSYSLYLATSSDKTILKSVTINRIGCVRVQHNEWKRLQLIYAKPLRNEYKKKEN